MYPDYLHLRKQLEQGTDTCVSVVSGFLQKIESQKKLNIFLEVYADEALAAASVIDSKIKAGTAGKLAGMVIALKDNICYKNHGVSASSKILENFVSVYNATATERLLAEDAIIIGRTNCDEFAMGSSNENSAFSNVLNPHNNELVSGGSSGGSAAAVAAGLCHAALGSDTGGSIRQPASFCGVVGMRPTYGRISRHGLLAFASSMDQIGPITSNVYDAALLMEVISGADDYDATVSHQGVPEYTNNLHKVNKYNIAYLGDCINNEGVDAEIRSRFAEIQKALTGAGHTFHDATFPYLDYVVPTYYVLATAEASSNLSRYAGMTYGYRAQDTITLDDLIIKSRTQGFGEEVKRRIILGTFVLSEGYYDAYYTKGMKVRRLIADYTHQMLEENDFIMLPTAPTTAFKIGQNSGDPIAMYLADIFTIQSALAGIPSISLPLGKHSNGMPFGIQLMSKKFDEERLFAFSENLMREFGKQGQ